MLALRVLYRELGSGPYQRRTLLTTLPDLLMTVMVSPTFIGMAAILVEDLRKGFLQEQEVQESRVVATRVRGGGDCRERGTDVQVPVCTVRRSRRISARGSRFAAGGLHTRFHLGGGTWITSLSQRAAVRETLYEWRGVRAEKTKRGRRVGGHMHGGVRRLSMSQRT